jgi:hypothetical protein
VTRHRIRGGDLQLRAWQELRLDVEQRCLEIVGRVPHRRSAIGQPRVFEALQGSLNDFRNDSLRPNALRHLSSWL